MSHIQISLSSTKPDEHWAASSPVTFSGDKATIHLSGKDWQQTQTIKKAARLIETLANGTVQLTGDWRKDQQWDFATSFVSPNKTQTIHWCENDDKTTLTQNFEAMIFTRDIVNATPEDISPEILVERSEKWLSSLSNKVTKTRQWVGEELKAAGWTGIYNVGRGSTRPPVLAEFDYNPTDDENAPVAAALVGKGITFDSGGYSIKSSEGMLSMKYDMGGAATVTGALGLAIMQGMTQRIKLYLCCAENLISGHAYKLGDVLTYKNGVTVEVVNTDAEGRLVLADGLLAASETKAPLILDAATLTGAAMVAVGNDYNAIFSLDKNLISRTSCIAEDVKESVWPLPLEIWHQNKCPSAYADTANSRPQKGGGMGGASNAAGFLSRFVPNEGKGWIHFDLAAAFNSGASSVAPAGATAMGIKTIAKLIQSEQ
jgi:PepB aminopeptidase